MWIWRFFASVLFQQLVTRHTKFSPLASCYGNALPRQTASMGQQVQMSGETLRVQRPEKKAGVNLFFAHTRALELALAGVAKAAMEVLV